MVRDAEQYAEKDRERKELIEARNEADTLCYSMEKSLQEHKVGGGVGGRRGGQEGRGRGWWGGCVKLRRSSGILTQALAIQGRQLTKQR
jgi:hypothetical protein